MRFVRYLLLGLAVILLGGGLGLWFYSMPANSPKEMLFVGGEVLTMVGEPAEAIHVSDGKIVAVGRRDVLEASAGPSVPRFDLSGGVLMPGLIEPHTHPIASALLGAAVDVSGFTHANRAQIMQTLADAVNSPLATPWVIAFGWDPVMVADLEPPTLAELDKLSPDRPLVILTQMMHDAYANSAALSAAGIGPSTRNPPGAEFVRDDTGELTGVIRENAAIMQLMKSVPKPPRFITRLLVSMQLGKYSRSGYTSIGVLGPVGRIDQPLGLLSNLLGSKLSPVRGVVYALPEQIGPQQKPQKGPHYSLRGVKFWMDGSPFAGGAAWAEPYVNSPLVLQRLHLPPDHMAPLNYTEPEFESLFREYHHRGFAIATHVQGERAIDLVLNVAERILADEPRANHGHRLEHNALITSEQMKRARKLGIELSFFVDHIRFYGDKLDGLVGRQRRERYMPLATAMSQGHRISVHGDHPASPVDPFRTLATAVRRRSRAGELIGASQALTVEQALRAMTINAAVQLGIDDQVGSIEVGKLADLVWLDANPLKVSKERIELLEVKQTWIAGQAVDSRKIRRQNLRQLLPEQ